MLGPRQLLDDAGTDFPAATLDSGFLLAVADFRIELGAAQLTFDLDIVTLLEALRVLGGLSEADDAVPLGARDPLVGLLVFVAGLGGE